MQLLRVNGGIMANASQPDARVWVAATRCCEGKGVEWFSPLLLVTAAGSSPVHARIARDGRVGHALRDVWQALRKHQGAKEYIISQTTRRRAHEAEEHGDALLA